MEYNYENNTGNTSEKVALVNSYFKKELYRGFLILLPVLCLGPLGFAPLNLVADQLVYVKLGGNLNQKNANASENCANDSKHEDHIQEQATQFRMYMRWGSCLSSILFTPLWGAHSDKYGRHIAVIVSSIGALSVTLSYIGILLVEEIPLWILILGDICHGICGKSFNLLLLATAAVVADIMPKGQRTFMMIALDFFLLIFATISQVGVGYWIKYSGFSPSLILMIITQLLSGLYGLIILPKYTQSSIVNSLHTDNGNSLKRILEYFITTYKTFVKKRRNTYRAQLLLIILVILLQHIAFYGMSTVQNIYFLGMPLCWNSVMLGLFNGISIGVYGTFNLIVASVFIKLGSSLKFMVAGLVSALFGSIVYGFSTTTVMMYVSLMVSSLTIIFSPSTRCVISDIVDENEQGAALAGYVLPTLVGEVGGNSLYTLIFDLTIDSCPRCFYFVSSSLYGSALFFLCIIIYLSRKKTNDEELKSLTEDKEDG